MRHRETCFRREQHSDTTTMKYVHERPPQDRIHRPSVVSSRAAGQGEFPHVSIARTKTHGRDRQLGERLHDRRISRSIGQSCKAPHGKRIETHAVALSLVTRGFVDHRHITQLFADASHSDTCLRKPNIGRLSRLAGGQSPRTATNHGRIHSRHIHIVWDLAIRFLIRITSTRCPSVISTSPSHAIYSASPFHFRVASCTARRREELPRWVSSAKLPR
jgi:hypothetical protein